MACEAMHYLTRDAVHHSKAAHKVAACARHLLPRLAQQLHSIVQLQYGRRCHALHNARCHASLDGCPQSGSIRSAWHIDDACSTSMTARTAAASGCTWMVPCFESTAGLNQRLHSRWRHCVAHGASHRIMCCMACHAAQLGISASLHIYL